jgi:nitronate monooxygenase
VEFFYDTPDPSLISLVHAGGALAGWQVGSVAEARQAVDAGCDLIIAQAWRPAVMCGGRSGCYRCWPMCWTWLPSRYWRPVPSAAPGRWPLHWPPERQGSESGRGFVATEESGAHPDYVAALLVAHAEATILVEAFSVGWPGAPHRVLSSAVVAAEAHPDEAVAMLQTESGSQPIPLWSRATPSREMTGHVEAMALYAGQGVGQVTQVVPAAQVVTELAEGADRLLRRWGADPSAR